METKAPKYRTNQCVDVSHIVELPFHQVGVKDASLPCNTCINK